MADKKNQHYVPQHYLKRFCNQGTRQICLINLEQRLFVPIAPIANQCSENYFYGNDGKLESILGEIESRADPLFEKILVDKEVPHEQASRNDLLAILVILFSRTKKRSNELGQMHEQLLQNIIIQADKKELLPKPPAGIKVEDLKVKFLKSSELSILSALSNLPLVSDLTLKLLIAPKGSFFITSDHPVVVMNEMFYSEGVLGAAGLANRGVQIFLPLSPHFCVVAYDAQCYRISRPEKRSTIIEQAKDIDLINALQVANADENIYFSDSTLRVYCDNLLIKYSKLRNASKSKLNCYSIPEKKDVINSYLIYSDLGVTPPGKWSFCKQRFDLNARDFRPRDSNLCELVKQWHKEIGLSRNALPFSDWLDLKASLLDSLIKPA